MLLAVDSSKRCLQRRHRRRPPSPGAGSRRSVPCTRYDSTLPPQQVSWRSCVGDTRPFGNSTETSMPGRRWNAAATAPPVSPEVATRMFSGCRSLALADARQRGGEEARAEILERRGRAVEQLEHRQLAVVGHRHERRRKIEGVADDVAELARRADRPRRTGASMTSATSGRLLAPSNAASGMLGQVSGMYRPPSGARPCASAAPKLTAGD